MERSLSERRRPWWMTPFGREPMGDVWFDRLWPEIPRWQGEEYRPTFDFWEEGGTYHIQADLPGVKKEDIAIDVDGNVVTISGKRESEKEREEKSYFLRESRYGSFSRSFQLPGDVEEDKVDAVFKDGMLKVALPLKEGSRSRKIEIKT